ncbi:UDP-2,3-diacylglucosamine hydrolase [Klebsiella pneumoniae]|uniref:UDP-2,3-diacylglucosamine hydrolase n=1 Tax=Klebsiella pneumoniae TaxID=573 RepID=A0A377TRR3_KLEPN|nr:UDP-2,3-diacylglucosamine hydrolase [Klebsiella pneumoniae]
MTILTRCTNKLPPAIKAVVDADVPCYFIHGNRDFLVASALPARAG